MRFLARCTAALAVISPILAFAQTTSVFQTRDTSPLASLPKCGLACLIGSIGMSGCAATNTTCLCTNEAFGAAVSLCVAQNCTIEESLITKNLTDANCGVPIRRQGEHLVNLSITMAVISAATVLLRLGYKLSVHKGLTTDDIVIFILIIVGIPSVVITVHGTTANGLGSDVWTLTAEQITNFGYWFYMMEILYFADVTLLKLTLLFFYLRIFPSQWSRRLLWATIVFTSLWGVTFIFLAIFQCRPISYFWTNWDGLHEGQCLQINSIGWANAGISIVLDLWMIAIPLWEVRSLQLHWKKKIGVVLMFCVGTFVTVVSILRLQTLVTFASSTNPTWDNTLVSIWSTVEVNVGIMCACMPTLRLMLVRIIPVLGSTRNRSGYRNTGSNGPGNGYPRRKPTGNLSSAATEVNVNVSDKGSGGADPPHGILYQKTYNITYGDESSQVNLRDLNRKGAHAEASSDVSDL